MKISPLQYLKEFKEGLISNISSSISGNKFPICVSIDLSPCLYVRLPFYLDIESQKNITNSFKKEFGLSECQS